MSPIPIYLRWIRNPPPAEPAAKQTAWLRSLIRPHAEFYAVMQVAGEMGADEAECEILLAAINVATGLEWSRDVGIAAARAEWPTALAAARETADRVIITLRPRVRRREPAAELLAAAASADRSTIFPTEVLINLCAKVAQAGARRHVRS